MPGRHRRTQKCQTFFICSILNFDDRGFDAGQWLAHGSRLYIHRGIVGYHDAAGLGLPPVIMKRFAKNTVAPDDSFGIERLADASKKSERGKVARAGQVIARHHQQPDGGRGRIPDIHAFGFQQIIPGLCVELAGIDEHRHAIG